MFGKKYQSIMFVLIIIFIVLLDQLSKIWIIWNIPENSIGFSFLNDFFRIIHTRNLGIAFSVGNNFPDFLRIIFFLILPFIFLVYLTYLLLGDSPFIYQTRYPFLNRLALILVTSGGYGNLIDRFFRNGVVDFIDIKFFGIMGLDRWPAFNLADSSVFIGAFCWILANFLSIKKNKKS